MGISGSFAAGRAQVRPMAGQPAPNERHGKRSEPDTSWSTPPASTGGGAPFAEAVDITMTARGIVLDQGHTRGHVGSAATAAARRPFTARSGLSARADAPYIEQQAAQDAAAAAHGDGATAYRAGHQYQPMPQQTAGAAYEVVQSNVRAVPRISGRAIAKGQPGGSFSDGDQGEYGPAGFNTGEAGRFAVARYSSPTLGAMYSRNTPRGVLPQVHVPSGVSITEEGGQPGKAASGIPSNTRAMRPLFTRPQLFRSPASESARLMAEQAGPDGSGSSLGVGF